MANLEVSSKMSVWQFGVVLMAFMLGAQFVSLPDHLVPQAKQLAWISVILGGGLFFGMAWIMLKLAAMYPHNDITEYLPRLLGKWGGLAVIGILMLVFLLELWVAQTQFSRVLVFFMFDRTPPDVLIMSMLAVVVYAAVQDLGTIIRIAQLIFFISVAMSATVWSAGIFNLQPENLLPFWTDKPEGIFKAVISTYGIYNGYESILLLFPLISSKRNNIIKVTAVGFTFITLVGIVIIVMTIGVLSVESVKSESYPTLVVVRSVELPGTFIERLENYFLIAWIPLIFNSQTLILYGMARIMSKVWGHVDHRPWVLALAPFIYTGVTLLDGNQWVAMVEKTANFLGLAFSLGIIPLVYLYAKRKQHEVETSES